MVAAAAPLAFAGPPGWLVLGVLAIGTLAVGAYAMSESSPSEDADRKADEGLREGAATDACSTCDPDPCKRLGQEITGKRNELAKRYSDLLEDKYGLFALRPDGIPGVGSWDGHIQQFENKQANLRKSLNEASARGCGDQGDAWSWATREPPTRPSPGS
ncbi:hypothetical protein [Inquilinus limosus]|uniref:hypothetical protein n=1 Tax=Inquilinus limosus TaxID=171674 RepID=UPI0012DC8ABE|nr:hypothetical protein [Inquilinus limosus]